MGGSSRCSTCILVQGMCGWVPRVQLHISAQGTCGRFPGVQDPHLSTGQVGEGPQGAVCVSHSHIVSCPGKTTLIKALTGESTMQPCDQLFTTLDVTAHAGLLPSCMPILYMDTIGFLSQLPHSLIQSFSTTLEDVVHSVGVCTDGYPWIRLLPRPDVLGSTLHMVSLVFLGMTLPVPCRPSL